MATTEAERVVVNQVLTDEQAQQACGGHVPPAGYMRSVVFDGRIGWLRNLRVSQVLLFCPVDSFPPGVGLGALRRMI